MAATGAQTMTTDDLTPDEQERLRRARVDIAPGGALEAGTIAALRERGLVRPRRSRAPFVWITAAVLAVAAFALVARGRAPAPAGPRFVLLLYAAPSGPPSAGRHDEYAQWARDLRSRGVAISGEELDGGALLVGSGGAPEPPAGFFVVGAPDLSAARDIAATCPHVRHGGRIIVRQVAG
jgi:hypothetical protein